MPMERNAGEVPVPPTEAALREAQTRASAADRRSESLRRIIEVLPIGIIAYRENRALFVNPAFTQLLDVTWEEIAPLPVSQVVEEFFVQEERPQGAERLQQAATGRYLPPVERHVRTRAGELRVVELQTMTVDVDDQPAQITVVRDLTGQRRLEGQVALADRMASVGRIAAGVAHELNNPLSYVLGNLDLAREELPQIVDECRVLQAQLQLQPEMMPRAQGVVTRLHTLSTTIREASDGADRVRAIMRDLKSFSRPDADDRRALVDLSRPLDAAVRMAWREIQPRARLVHLREAVPEVRGIEGRLCQVFLNLLVNAAEAIPEGASLEHEVRIETRTNAAGEAVVSISDTGPGIPPYQLPHLFEPFFTTKGPGKGTGLGLSICHDIVRAHGGRLEVDSVPGHGATFRVVLPPATEPAPMHRATSVSGQIRRGRILIVDDEPHVAGALRQVIGKNHDTTLVDSGRAALTLIEQGHRYDVIFCDLMMPGMGGMDLHSALMSLARDQCDRIVFTTGGAYTNVVREFLTHVPNQHLEKPFVLKDVRDTLAAMIA